ncbi:hypothetical protein S7335_1969 [Synechococcus sp. PCC 7335]|uniref:hypothetical protein n=1 Tax=Synechococcus sp. (strain ATCC 29403 / PCC 7335) TaxID=91464 RepID=UPI00017EE3DE|nr:hypothetical protein [Synechococcus sp. PCC 7335]EDX84272.1 hypothetical protein S7335_1969 [Synechococcus sp. PCC 7335]
MAGVDSSGNAQIVDDRGNCSYINLQGQQYIDYALVSTTYSSQGKTADRVLALMDSTTSQESFDVAASRAKHHLSIYTADVAELAQKVRRSRAKENASDYIPLFQVVNSHAQTQKENDSTLDYTHDRRDVGECIGSRIAERLTASLWRDSIAQAREYQAASSTIRYTSLSENLERAGSNLTYSANAIESNPSQIIRAIEKRQRHWQQFRQATAMLNAIGKGVDRLTYQVGQQQRLSTRVSEGFIRLKSAIVAGRLNRKHHYQKLWKKHSQGVQVKNPCSLDIQVAARAFRTGLARRDIVLMLIAGSPYVRSLYRETNRKQVMLYMQQTVKHLHRQSGYQKVSKQDN